MAAQTLTPVDQVVLAEGRLGAGLYLVGGMTTSNFHNPDPQASELRANILLYAGGFEQVPLSPVSPQVNQSPRESSRP